MRKALLLLSLITYPFIWVAGQECNVLSKANDLDPNSKCAPVDVDWTVEYRGVYSGATTVEIRYEWDDGTVETVTATESPSGSDDYVATASHTYPKGLDKCNYRPRAYLVVDGSICSSTVQEQNVTVWDTDDHNGGNIAVNPQLFRVCVGNAADVTFEDNSEWNCVPPEEEDNPNNENRWTQWIYGINNSITGTVTIDGSSETYPYEGTVDYYPAPVLSPSDPNATSKTVNIPADAQVGEEFEVKLNNWNTCNPYEDADGNPTGNTPVSETALIRIVDDPDPDYITRLEDQNGVEQDTFCIGDNVYFDNQTPSVTNASYEYTWEFYSGPTDGSTLLATKTTENPDFSFADYGTKLVRLRVKDNNSYGNCEAVYEDSVEILQTAEAKIKTTDQNGNTITPDFCQPSDTSETFYVEFHDDSNVPNPGVTTWTWNFFAKNSNTTIDSTTTGQGPFTGQYQEPGKYMVELITADDKTSCETRDTVFVNISHLPEPSFTHTTACQGDSITFNDQSQITGGNAITKWEWDFDYNGSFQADTTFSTTTEFSYMYNAEGSYQVALQVTSAAGCDSLITKNIEVSPQPEAAFTPDKTEICPGEAVTFTNNSLDNQPSGVTIDTFQYFIAEPGRPYQSFVQPDGAQTFTYEDFTNNTDSTKNYRVYLQAISQAGCSHDSPVDTIKVTPGKKLSFTSDYDFFEDNCSPRTINFSIDSATRQYTLDNFIWTVFEDSAVVARDTVAADNYTYAHTFRNESSKTQNYTVRLNAISNSSGCITPDEQSLKINPVPSADFSMTIQERDCQRVKYLVEAEQKGLPEYNWNITPAPENSPAYGESFELIYQRPSVDGDSLQVNASLQTTNFANCQSKIRKDSLYIQPGFDPEIDIDANPQNMTIPDKTVTIENLSQKVDGNYLWEFGDGQTSTQWHGNEFQHEYAEAGQYTISFSVERDGCVKKDSLQINITPRKPEVDFEFSPTSGCRPLTVQFNNLTKFADPDSYRWDFGEGQGTSAEENPSYTFYEEGEYTVTLTAENSQGEKSQEKKAFSIEVYDRPDAGFNVRPNRVFLPDEQIAVANLTPDAEEYLWKFGDGTTSTEFQPNHLYKETGTYDITLIATNANGCRDTLTKENIVLVRRGGEAKVPNAFTPDESGPGSGETSDGGYNDVFLPHYEGVQDFHMLIYNQWGELLFESHDKNKGWDGYFQGKLSPQGVYVYKIKLTYSNGETDTKIGDVTLIR